MMRKIEKLVKENEKRIVDEVISEAIQDYRVVVYYSMDDGKIHADAISHGTIMDNDEIVINYFEGRMIDNDKFNKEAFLASVEIIDYNILNDEIENKSID